MTEKLFNSVVETAQALGVSEWTVFALIRRGELHSVKIGARRLIPETALQAYVARLGADEPIGRSDADVSA